MPAIYISSPSPSPLKIAVLPTMFTSPLSKIHQPLNLAAPNNSVLYTLQMTPASANAAFAPFYDPSGLTYSNIPQQKRPRESPLSFLSDDISSQLLQQTQQADQLILNHAEKVRTELLEHRRRCWMQALAAVEEAVSKQLRMKDEEIERIRKLNWALEERIRGLSVEIEIWRKLAQTNEAAVVVLRSNLEQVLARQVGADDAESSCRGDNLKEMGCNTSNCATRLCRNCEVCEVSVLLLPCRHLSLCSSCGPVVNVCPVCKCKKQARLHVSMA